MVKAVVQVIKPLHYTNLSFQAIIGLLLFCLDSKPSAVTDPRTVIKFYESILGLIRKKSLPLRFENKFRLFYQGKAATAKTADT